MHCYTTDWLSTDWLYLSIFQPANDQMQILSKDTQRAASTAINVDGNDMSTGLLTRLKAANSSCAPSLSRDDALQLLVMYISAVIHDYDHGGLTNAFLVEDGDILAVSKQFPGSL